MSPRSSEMFARARENLASAETQVAAGHNATAVSTAYYAMLYAVRAMLSERELNARTHRGTWQLFRKAFVESGSFDAQLTREAQDAQRRREASDYAAATFTAEEAKQTVALARRFVARVDHLIG